MKTYPPYVRLLTVGSDPSQPRYGFVRDVRLAAILGYRPRAEAFLCRLFLPQHVPPLLVREGAFNMGLCADVLEKSFESGDDPKKEIRARTPLFGWRSF